MKIIIENINTVLETVSEADAASICELRNDPTINKYLSSSEHVSIGQQQVWIKNNLGDNNGLYFKILDRQSRFFLGTISIYNVNKDLRSAEFGRYICKSSLHAIEAELMILNLAFEIMCMKNIYCRTANDNTKVWEQHYKFGFKDSGFETLNKNGLLLRKQDISIQDYFSFNYDKITRLIERFRN